MNEKKTYTSPELTVHGNVEDITQNGHVLNKDVPGGNVNTAYPS